MGFGHHKTIYQGDPSDEVDQAWNSLYNGMHYLQILKVYWLIDQLPEFGLSKIPKEQARLLPNKTLPIPGDEGYYAVGLAVFHQLHCLVSENARWLLAYLRLLSSEYDQARSLSGILQRSRHWRYWEHPC